MIQVVVGLIIKYENNEPYYFLVSSKKDFLEHSGKYYPPGGHIELGETPFEALVREFSEELNVKIKDATIVATFPNDLGELTQWYLVSTNSQINPNFSELKDGQFFSKSQLKNLNLWPASKKFISDYILAE